MSERHIGKYEVLTTLGKGSMGVVYKARDPEIGRLVAIKTLKSMVMGDDAAGEEALQRFRQESRSAGMLHHPNVVTIFEAGKTENGSPYIVMEHIEGYSLEQRVSDQGALPPLEVVHYLAQVASAIDYAHTHDIIHRDIKPSNIIVSSNYKPFLLDFGVAKLADTSLTPAGTVVGTPSYMSPEQIRGLQLDGRTDIFSLAVVAFELFTGVRPYPGKDFTTVVTNIMHKEPRSFEELEVRLPAALETQLHKGLAKDREERFSSALSMVHAFAQVFSVLVDGGGLVGGYDPSMDADRQTLEYEAAGKKTTVPVKRPSLTDVPRASGRIQVPQPINTAPRTKWLYAIGFMGLLACGGFVAFAALHKSNPSTSPMQSTSAAVASEKQTVQVLDAPGSVEEASDTQFSENAPVDTSAVVSEEQKTPTLEIPQEPAGGFQESDLDSFSDEVLSALAQKPELSSSSLRLLAAELGHRGSGKFARDLVELLAHRDFAVRVSALKSLRSDETLSQPEVIDAVIVALNDQEYLVRGFAAKILSDSPEPRVVKALQERRKVETRDVVQQILDQALSSSAQ